MPPTDACPRGHAHRSTSIFSAYGSSGAQSPTVRSRWYAYATLTEDGRVTAWDFAPDEAWLRTLPNHDVQFGGYVGNVAWGHGL